MLTQARGTTLKRHCFSSGAYLETPGRSLAMPVTPFIDLISAQGYIGLVSVGPGNWQRLGLALSSLHWFPSSLNLAHFSCSTTSSILVLPQPEICPSYQTQTNGYAMLSLSLSTKIPLALPPLGLFSLLTRLQLKTESWQIFISVCSPGLSNHISGTLRSEGPLVYLQILAVLCTMFTVCWRSKIDKVSWKLQYSGWEKVMAKQINEIMTYNDEGQTR